MKRCNNELKNTGHAYPRTCEMCGLGPCHNVHLPSKPPVATGEATPTRDEAVPIGYMRPADKDGNSFWCSRQKSAYYTDPVFATAPAPASGGVDAVETFASCGAWADETFGPATPQRRLERAGEELVEALSAPTDKLLEEMADTVICVAAAAHSVGGDLQAAIDAKMSINRKRRWSVRGDGTGYHIPAAASLSPAATPVAEAGGETYRVVKVIHGEVTSYQPGTLVKARDICNGRATVTNMHGMGCMVGVPMDRLALAKPASSPAGGFDDLLKRARMAALSENTLYGGTAGDLYNDLADAVVSLSQSTSAGRVCEICGGDCSAANPPPTYCPSRDGDIDKLTTSSAPEWQPPRLSWSTKLTHGSDVLYASFLNFTVEIPLRGSMQHYIDMRKEKAQEQFDAYCRNLLVKLGITIPARGPQPCAFDDCQEPGRCDGRHCNRANGALRHDEDLDGPFTSWYPALPFGWKPIGWRWGLNTLLCKKSGSWWEGRVVGFYSTPATPHGYALQLDKDGGPVQIYPETALEEM